MTLSPVKKITPKQLNKAIKLNILTGCLATVWGIVCSPQPLFNVFVINHLGASASTLGLLVALLQLSGLFQLASIFIYGYARRRKPFFITAHLIHRLLTLAIAAAAFVAAATGNTGWGIRAIMIAVPLSWVFMNASAAGWWSWVADLFPENIRGAFFLKRSAIINVVNVIWFFLASMVLDLIKGPYTFWIYGAIFSIGALSGIVDIILNLFIPEPEPAEMDAFNPADALEPLKNRNFIQFSIAVGLAVFFINMIGPFQSPFIVDPKGVAAPNTWLGIMFVISQLTWVVTAPFWGTIMDKWGRKPVVILGCFFVLSWTGYFFLNHRTYIYILPLISIAGGLLAPAFWEGGNQMMLSLAPGKNRIAYVAWYMTLVGLVSSGGSLLGGAILDALSEFHISLLRLSFSGFHVVQLGSMLMVIFSALIISRVREGRERDVGFVIGRVTNPGILKTYACLYDLDTACDPGRTEQALRSIEAKTGDLALDEIIARLDDPYLEIREEAARALGRIRSAYAVEPLIKRLGDSQTHFQIAIVRALGKIRDRRAVGPLIECLTNTTSEALQEACIQALGDIGGEEAAEAVGEFYRHAPNDHLRATAADAASRLGLFEATSELFPRLIAGKSSSIRRQYAIALGNMFGPPGEFYPFLSGSEGTSADRISRLFHQLEWKIRSTNFKLHKTPITKLSKTKIQERIDTIREVREHLDAEQDLEALRKITSFAQDLLAEILGEAVESRQFQELAFRIDIYFGSFVWFLEEVQKYLAGEAKHSADQGETLRLLTLLIVFFLDSNWN